METDGRCSEESMDIINPAIMLVESPDVKVCGRYCI
jgi:hypothetical protein